MKIKRPLKRSIFLFILAFLTLLCFVFSIITYRAFNTSLYRAYNRRMVDIINNVMSHIDLDDLSECIETGVESEKYTKLVTFMDSIMEDFDIHYLYIVKPVLEGEHHGMMNVISADTAEGRATDPDGYFLGYVLYDVYGEKDLLAYQDALDSDTISYYKNFSTWGYDYTAAMPLINSKGEHFALLCVDIEVRDVEFAIMTYTISVVLLIVILGVIFTILFILWMNRYVTEPIFRLEKSVDVFARSSHEQVDPNFLVYEDPGIHSQNEVEVLSNAITQMASDIKTYAINILEAESQVEDMKNQMSYMDIVAYQDALTHVKNKAWYDNVEKRVNDEISKGEARFGIVMADLNNLKKINDTYGHEHGNDYIFGACHKICVVYEHSPIFRIGGDEFVVLLENSDYDNREELIRKLQDVFDDTSSDEQRSPWRRYSIAMGMAIYDKNIDKDMNDVFKRADELMYKNKVESKMARE
ncbi:GGDEF domain-containing protein [Butyrivibrio sp. VCD2006]|uniref:GGDEF domain-containing protein n=1 Tax=Butyrivibrio sp. VCD2006 TaxID=1280664 RepID=UPI0004163711|nr:GGDEF domain-containing protein [Butyrivibrio sp. VCD2006]